MSKIHELKCDPAPFQESLEGRKPFEIRLNDRGYKVGDIVTLCETEHSAAEMAAGEPMEYTGRIKCMGEITNITHGYGLNDGFVVLGFGKDRAAEPSHL